MKSADAGSSHSPETLRLVQRLIGDEGRAAKGATSRALDASRAAERLFASLSGWIGVEGCHALFSRGHAESLSGRRQMSALQLRVREQPYVAGVEESITRHGDGPTADFIESMLITVINLLGRLVGPEMATNLIERSLSPISPDAPGPTERKSP